jgi:hypothetical protein
LQFLKSDAPSREMKLSLLFKMYGRLLAAAGAAAVFPSCVGANAAAQPQMGAGPRAGLTVVNRNADASQLQFSDGSRWAIQPAGQAVTLTWQPNDPMEVIRTQHPAYPAVLSNLRTGQGTRARPAGGGY